MLKVNSIVKILPLIAVCLLFLISQKNIYADIGFDYSEIISDGIGRTDIGDIDGDGYNDIVVHTWASGSGTVADGKLVWYKYPDWTKTVIKGNDFFFGDAIIIADIDSDGDNDVVTCKGSFIDAQIWWYENPGDEALYNWVEHFVGTVETDSEVKDIEAHDIDLDNKVDIVVRTKHKVALYFQESPVLWTSRLMDNGEREGMAIGDIDNDNDYDIVLNGYWLENPNDPRLDPWIEYTIDDQWYTDTTGGWQDFSVLAEVADVNGDSLVDVIFSQTEKTGFFVTWYETNDPKGGQSAWIKHEIMVVDYCHTLQAADMDLDGDIDIIAGTLKRTNTPKVFALINEGNGAAWTTQVVDSKSAYKGAVGDIDNDGDYDIVSARSWEDAPIQLWRNTTIPNLAFDQWQKYLIDGSMPQNAVFIKSGDMDGDGLIDLVAGAWWWKNPGLFSDPWSRQSIGSPLNNAAIIYDFDGDGDLDIFGTQGVGAATNNSLAWGDNDGFGNFTIYTNISTGGNGDFLQGCEIADLGSGKQIVLSWHNGGGGIQAVSIPADPAVNNWAHSILSTTTQTEDISIGDIDDDGDLDILLGTEWLRNDLGNWTPFTLGTIFDLDNDAEPDRVDLADINGDRRLDAIVGLEYGTPVLWFEAPEDRTLSWTRHIIGNADGEGLSMDVTDFDRDGDPDVVLGEHNGTTENRVMIFENVSQGSLWSQYIIDSDLSSVIDHHDGTQAVDMDGDGDKDIFSVGWTNKKVWLYENLAITGGQVFLPPVAKITTDFTIQLAPATINFDGSSSFAPTGTIVSYDWDFDDGSVASGVNVSNTFESIGSYNVKLVVTDDNNAAGTAFKEITVIPSNTRVTDSLVIIYTFEEDSGNTIFDVSGVGSPLNLNINSPAAVNWNDHGLSINSSASINSITTAAKINNACQATDEITIEAWLIPATTEVENTKRPARIFSLSNGWTERNFTLGQGAYNVSSDLYDVRLRTTTTGLNGSSPSLSTPGGILTLDTTHVVYTRSASGSAKTYVNGIEVASANISGDLSNWGDFSLYLGNEQTGDRPWTGELLLAAVYNKALSDIEVNQNYNFGEGGQLKVAILKQPDDQTVLINQTAAFSIQASGYGTLNYQWQKNNVDIPLGNSQIYITDPLSIVDSGAVFRCIVTDNFGADTSNNAVLNVLVSSPNISQQPDDQFVSPGDSATFSVQVSGYGQIVYQWQKNGVDIPSADSSSYTTPAATPADNGALFRCIVSDDLGIDTSSAAILTVHQITISQQPETQIAFEGQTATFNISATGDGPLSYQWKKDDVDIPGANDSTYITPPTIQADSGSIFTCAISDTIGSVLSNGAELQIIIIDWTASIMVDDNGGKSDSIMIGQSNIATDSIDLILGELELPPIPPPGTYVTRLILPGDVHTSKKDYRSSSLSYVLWRLIALPGPGGYPMTISWNPLDLPAGRFTLKDPINGTFVNVDMLKNNSYSLPDGIFPHLIIEYGAESCGSVDVFTGWNLISVPYESSEMDQDTLFPSRSSDVFGFENSYLTQDTLENGKGYWVKFDSLEVFQICGFKINTPISVSLGWNLIGIYEETVMVNSITTDPPGLLSSSFFGSNGSYFVANELLPGKGYWIKVNANGELSWGDLLPKNSANYVSAPEIKDSWGRIIVEDSKNRSTVLYIADDNKQFTNLELPPAPPQGVFDVRYANDKFIIGINDVEDLLVNWANYPIKIKVEGVDIKIRDKIDGSFVNNVLRKNDEIIISNDLLKQFEIEQIEVPISYELFQNYPNPFNPATKIKFGIPQPGLVKLTIYNILGERVESLLAREMLEGFHEVEFNAARYSSGVYFYRITAGAYSAVKKMMLLK